MKFESFPQINYLENIERCIVHFEESEQYEQAFGVLKDLYKADAYKYPVLVNSIKKIQEDDKITHEEHTVMVSIFLAAQRSDISLENIKRTLESYSTTKDMFFDYDEIRTSGLPQQLIDYLELRIAKITSK